MTRFSRAELEEALATYNPSRDAPGVVRAWREAGGRFLAPEQVRMRHR